MKEIVVGYLHSNIEKRRHQTKVVFYRVIEPTDTGRNSGVLMAYANGANAVAIYQLDMLDKIPCLTDSMKEDLRTIATG